MSAGLAEGAVVKAVHHGWRATALSSGFRWTVQASGTLAQRGADALCRSTLLLHALFGVRVPRERDPTIRFDVTTYVLARHVQALVSERSHIVDMGSGPAATVGLFLWRRTGCSVTCVDVHGPSVASARDVIAHNRAPLEVLRSDLFDEVRGSADAVVFNPPYVPTVTGARRGLSARSRSQWDGGADGTDVIQRFVAAVAGGRQALRAYMGVNRRHVAPYRVADIIEAEPSLRLEAVTNHWLLPVTVFTFGIRRAVPAC